MEPKFSGFSACILMVTSSVEPTSFKEEKLYESVDKQYKEQCKIYFLMINVDQEASSYYIKGGRARKGLGSTDWGFP